MTVPHRLEPIRHVRRLLAFVWSLLILAAAAPVVAQEWSAPLAEIDAVTASDGVAANNFGWSVSLSGDAYLVGSRWGGGCCAGQAHVYRRDAITGEFEEEAILEPTPTECSAEFGRAVTLDGDVAIIGSPFRDDRAGAAYVFEYDESAGSWSQEQSLSASDGSDGDQFGFAVACQGDLAAVGARGRDLDTGAVYLFRKLGASWSEEQILVADDGASGDMFGLSIAILGDRVCVGSPRRDGRIGAVYLFELNATTGDYEAVQTLLASDGSEGDIFGVSVAVTDERIVVGSDGAVYVFEYDDDASEWTETDRLEAEDTDTLGLFGTAVDTEGNKIVAGAPGQDAAYIFRFESVSEEWIEEKKFVIDADDEDELDNVGHSVSILEPYVAVGAPKVLSATGAGYLFRSTCDLGDENCSGAVDADDLCDLANCFSGAAASPGYIEPGGACRIAFDSDGDGDIDTADALAVLAEYTGEPIDCNANDVNDIEEILLGDATDCDGNCIPDDCDPDTDLDGVIDACEFDADDLALFVACFEASALGEPLGGDCLRFDSDANGLIDVVDLDAFLLTYDFIEDCDDNGIADVRDVLMGDVEDCNCDLIPDSCQPDEDDDGVPDVCDLPQFLRGDVDGNGTVFCLAEAIRLLGWAFQGGESLPCLDAADVDDNGVVFPLADAVFLLTWCFQGGAPPPAPGVFECCPDPTDDTLGCLQVADACQ